MPEYRILDGRKTAARIRQELSEQISALDFTPVLAVVLVGDDPASRVYVRNKEKAAAKVGIRTRNVRMSGDVSQDEVLEAVKRLAADPEVDGILVQLPLPSHMDEDAVLAAIPPEKDVDGFHPLNQGRVFLGDASGLVPCTPAGVMEILKRHDISIAGRHAVIIGRSRIVGRPLAALMLAAHATVTVCHSKTPDLAAHVRSADILVSASGVRGLVDPSWIRDGAVVVDVGIHRLKDGSLAGDLDFEPTARRASWITPVPGGVGPMTVTMLLVNTLRAAHMRRGV